MNWRTFRPMGLTACAVSMAMAVGALAAPGLIRPDGDKEKLQQRLGMTDGDFSMLLRIMDEGKNNNKVMEHLSHLCLEIGPRLTGSTRAETANHWVAEQFEAMGLDHVEVRQWGEIPVRFDRGPSSGKMTKPVEREFEFTARSWSAGTNGTVRGLVLREPRTEEAFEAIKDKVAGAWILRSPGDAGRRGVVGGGDEPREFLPDLHALGIAGLITTARAEIVNTGGARGWRDMNPDELPTEVSVTIRRSDYDAINSRLADGDEVEVEFDLNHTFVKGPIPVYNTIGEIRGSVWPDEVVIIGAHLDSWDGPGSQGTVDNGTGSSVTIEAARILKAAGAKPKRTIRFLLFTGEEQGLLGSRAYVAALPDEEKAKISAIFVDDSGTNRESSLTAIASMEPILGGAVEAMNYAFPDMPVELQVRDRMPRGGASDHASFNAAGIPGFFWGKTGRADYRYAWHTQNDKIDQAIPEYLTMNSTVSAIAAFVLAQAETLLPRQVEEAPQEQAAEGRGESSFRAGVE